MFTGIVLGMAEVIGIDKKDKFQTHTLRFTDKMRDGLEVGASVAHNGCCLTVTEVKGESVKFDLMQETLRITNLGELSIGDFVNIERAAKFGDEIGGHSMSGHINRMTHIVAREESKNNVTLWFEIDESTRKYVLEKGYVGLDGCSLTIGTVENDRFCVHLIPETLQRTLFGKKQVGSSVNIEIDPQTQAIVDTVERVLASKA
ncbi:riboflavin synthase subunit alpha [Vibrio astriarenae]|uniref:Riboflavin synthase n=1 Tax=Vibrio astriarenae TaxID=1481923 RepID=A0A7Z2T320_9VIBR|nr:riboflavin synthase subunit alpha [Vibrio astriarenae]QIA63372.1 riboflavin synthase subunit alpha [Vibrio astriarenae]